jgi:asparagine synthase (glutamine-hydrolysing)
MRRAVADRLPESGAVVSMSGGLDSTCVAAFAAERAETSGGRIRACTFDYRRSSRDREAEYALAAAEALQIPLELIDCDGDRLEWASDGGRGFYPEPFADTPTSASFRRYLDLLEQCRVGLTGEGGDPALHPRPRHAGRFFWHLLFGGLGKAAFRHHRETGRIPRLGLRGSIRQWIGRHGGPQAAMPPWLAPDFAGRCDLTGLFSDLNRFRKPIPCLRSEAHRFVTRPIWPMLFERKDAGATGVPAQVRHPFFDLRVMRFLLSLPPIPWCVDKEILRRTLSGRLPEKIVRRPKAPLPGHPVYEMIRAGPRPLPVGKLLADSGIARFVDLRRYLQILQNPDKIRPDEVELITRPLGLAWWLMQPKPGGR